MVANPANTVTHGDYRLDNLMFAGPQGGAADRRRRLADPGHGARHHRCELLPRSRRRCPKNGAVIERDLVDEYGQALADYGVAVDSDHLWMQYRRDAYAGIVMSVIASQIVGSNNRSEAMFAAMATRHAQHAPRSEE